MQQITKRQIESRLASINKMLGNEIEPYGRDESGAFKANVGTLYLAQAYGGFKIEQIANESGGCNEPFPNGFGTKRQCLDALVAYEHGLTARK